jgi:hypothetical protein
MDCRKERNKQPTAWKRHETTARLFSSRTSTCRRNNFYWQRCIRALVLVGALWQQLAPITTNEFQNNRGGGGAFLFVHGASDTTGATSNDQTCTSGSSSNGECVAAAPPKTVDATTQSITHNENDQCTLYLHPSTIKGAGVGIFTSIDRHKGQAFTSPLSLEDNQINDIGTDGCIPVVDLYWHTASYTVDATTKQRKKSRLFNPFADYFWTGYVMGMDSETQREDIEAYCPGLDCAVNCHLALINIKKAVPQYHQHESVHNDHGLYGAGAYSPYWNSTTVASRDILAGSELFKHYGGTYMVLLLCICVQ